MGDVFVGGGDSSDIDDDAAKLRLSGRLQCDSGPDQALQDATDRTFVVMNEGVDVARTLT